MEEQKKRPNQDQQRIDFLLFDLCPPIYNQPRLAR